MPFLSFCFPCYYSSFGSWLAPILTPSLSLDISSASPLSLLIWYILLYSWLWFLTLFMTILLSHPCNLWVFTLYKVYLAFKTITISLSGTTLISCYPSQPLRFFIFCSSGFFSSQVLLLLSCSCTPSSWSWTVLFFLSKQGKTSILHEVSSWNFSPAKKNYSVGDNELLVVKLALK